MSNPTAVAKLTKPGSDLSAWLTFDSRIWDTSTGQCLRTLVYEENPAAASVCFSPNGRFVLASYTDSCVRLWDFINTPCTVKKTYQGHINKNYSIGGCFGLLRSSMRRLTVPTNGGDDDLNNDPDNENEFQEEQWVEGDSVAFVTSASEDGAIVLWDAKTKEVLQRIEAAHEGVCFWVDVHGETGTMVSCGQDGRIVVFRHRWPEPPAADGENGQPNGHDVKGGPGEDGEEKHPVENEGIPQQQHQEEEEAMADEATREGEGNGEGNGTGEAEPVQTNGHHEYHEGAGNEDEIPAAREVADTPMDG